MIGADQMRAAILEGPGQVRIDEVPIPQPGPGQVRVRLEGCGVCASNLTPWAGPEWMVFPTEPGALGHEGWGIIDAVGEAVEGLRVGIIITGGNVDLEPLFQALAAKWL